jgi:GR25 family glycosyltransferase involved in LPS biosynthesis|uniref:Glycosyl transferase family 25 domain-containing protein n=1 Tax=viral metagenome TaxID=1070528 RepID=A0A6C0JRL5_9ZZZZ
MKHFWINTDNNLKRRNFMTEQFKKYNIENYRISAITPKDFDNVLEQKRPLTCKHPGCTSCEYEYGCLSSHIKAMKECLKYDDPYYVIIEDDIYLPFKIDYDNLIKSYSNNFDIIQLLILYNNTIDTLRNHFINTGNLFIKWQYLLPSTGMYIISKQGAQKMVDLYVNKNNKYDFSQSKCQNVADVLIYSSIPTIATTLPYCYPNVDMGSEIHPDHLEAHKNAVDSIKNTINIIKNYPFVN